MSHTKPASRSELSRAESDLGQAIRAAILHEGAVSTRAFDRIVAGADASHYLFTPRATAEAERRADSALVEVLESSVVTPIRRRSV